jgi:hypothetical protein
MGSIKNVGVHEEFAQSLHIEPAQVPQPAFNHCSTILVEGEYLEALANPPTRFLSRSCIMTLDDLVQPHRHYSEENPLAVSLS